MTIFLQNAAIIVGIFAQLVASVVLMRRQSEMHTLMNSRLDLLLDATLKTGRLEGAERQRFDQKAQQMMDARQGNREQPTNETAT